MNNIINTATICLHNTNTDCWIIIDDIVYDVTAYIEKHPAGSEIIMNYAGKDASEEFNKTGHSHSAKKLLKTFIIGVTENYDNTIHHQEEFNNTNENYISHIKKRLITTEDSINLINTKDNKISINHSHKFLGVLCLLHYGYRFSKCIIDQILDKPGAFTAGFDSSFTSIFLIYCHFLLSYSSLIFNIPNKQSSTPMIWNEFRGHNIAFATRSILCCTVGWLALSNHIDKNLSNILRSAIVLGTLKSADLITQYLRHKNSETTTRTLPYWEDCPYMIEYFFKKYYMFAQYQATLVCLSSRIDNGISSPFFVMFPIQLASFLMTLVRKNIISTKIYHFTYFASLVLPFICHFRIIQNGYYAGILSLFASIVLCILRIYFRINKYVLWLPILYYNITNNLFSTIIFAIVLFLIIERDKPRKSYFLHHKNQKKCVTLTSKTYLTPDCISLKYKIPGNKKLGLKCGEHIICYSSNLSYQHKKWNNNDNLEEYDKIIQRKYTPIYDKEGEFEIVIRNYNKCEEFCDGGKMSRQLANMDINGKLMIAGPIGENIYNNGNFTIGEKTHNVKNILAICGGTGITPIIQLLDNINYNDEDNTKVHVIYVNRYKKDIILKKKLDSYKENFTINHILTRERLEENKNNSKEKNKRKKNVKNKNEEKNIYYGKPDKNLLEEIIDSKQSSYSITMLCGSTSFNVAMRKNLLDLGHTNIFQY